MTDMTLEELHIKLTLAGWQPLTWRTCPGREGLLPPNLSEILETFPAKGWIKVIRSAALNNMWCVMFEEERSFRSFEKWASTPEQAAGELWIRLKEEGLIKIIG